MKCLIRPIRESDTAGFAETLGAVCRERRYLATVEPPPLAKVAGFVSENVRLGHPQYVADEGGRVVGWCDAIPGAPGSGTRHVGGLGMGVLASHRGRGIGAGLLAATIDGAKRAGLEKIELSVYSSNLPAIGLYRRFGFVDEGCRKRGRLVDGIYDDVLIMGLFLG